MIGFRPPRPTGNSPEALFAQAVWDKLWGAGGGEVRQADVSGARVCRTSRGQYAIPQPTVAGGSGFAWQSPYKELDPTVAVKANTFVYVSPQNPIATVGLNDLVLGMVAQATPGIWQAIKTVPAKTDAGYHVPQDPVPDSGGYAPDGDPLEGDLDSGEDVYWLLWKSTC